MYIHAFDKKSKFSVAGSLVKLIYSLVTCVNQNNSKTCGILMIELAETRKGFSAAPFAMKQIKKLRCTSPPFLLLKSDYLSKPHLNLNYPPQTSPGGRVEVTSERSWALAICMLVPEIQRFNAFDLLTNTPLHTPFVPNV